MNPESEMTREQCEADKETALSAIKILPEILESQRKLEKEVLDLHRKDDAIERDLVGFKQDMYKWLGDQKAAIDHNTEILTTYVIKPFKKFYMSCAFAGIAWFVSSATGYSMADVIKFIASLFT